jgi:hypothetical protein
MELEAAGVKREDKKRRKDWKEELERHCCSRSRTRRIPFSCLYETICILIHSRRWGSGPEGSSFAPGCAGKRYRL